ncbi:MAG TPA: SemiSWEET family transporter, partial [Cyclobacteriaceae bacterium]
IFTATSLIPQFIKLIKEKKAGSVSVMMLSILFIGLALWIYYGILKSDWVIIISNTFALIINFLTGILTIQYSRSTKKLTSNPSL